MTDRTKSLSSMICPRCGRFGSLKRRTDRKHAVFFQVDHYRTRSHKSGYLRSCYLGTATPELAKKLYRLHPRHDPRILKPDVYPTYSLKVLKSLGLVMR